MSQAPPRLDGCESDLYLIALGEFEQVTETLDGLVRKLHGSLSPVERIKILEVRREAERLYRRYQLTHGDSGSEMDKALWWFSENGDLDDEAFLVNVNVGADREDLREMSLADIKRLRPGAPVVAQLDRLYGSGPLSIFLSASAPSVVLTIAVFGIHYAFSLVGLYFCLMLVVGLGSSVLLLSRATEEGSHLITRVCFGTGGLLLLTEVASAIHQSVLALGRMQR